jgi:hypothetical protein
LKTAPLIFNPLNFPLQHSHLAQRGYPPWDHIRGKFDSLEDETREEFGVLNRLEQINENRWRPGLDQSQDIESEKE